MKKYIFKALFLCLLSLSFFACEKAPQTPKPSTYLRVNVEKPHYIVFNDNKLPFTFQYPDYGKITYLDNAENDMKWFNISFDKYKFVANVSFLTLKGDSSLKRSVNDCYTFLKKHEKLSYGIVQQDYKNEGKHVYGTTFEIKGKDVVSPYQFYLTDSNRYFIRVALNYTQIPNNDSIAPIVNQLKIDLKNMINTFAWKK
jgi:gliding motility-associated lipoprotein GldD